MKKMSQNPNEVKIAVLGAGGVGKSALTLRLIADKFEPNYDPTIEDFYKQQMTVDGENVMLAILDTAGQDEYAVLQDSWIREGQGILLVYSVDQRNSLEKLEDLYTKIQEVQDLDANPDFPIAVACNKIDLPEGPMRQINPGQGEQLANRWRCQHYLTSAKQNWRVQDAFFDLVRKIRAPKAP